MRILLTNDDGIHAEGLAVLERIARTLSDDVWVVAPETDQSGFAHSLSLSEPLRLRKIGDQHFAVRGTPTDCVIMGVRKILPDSRRTSSCRASIAGEHRRRRDLFRHGRRRHGGRRCSASVDRADPGLWPGRGRPALGLRRGAAPGIRTARCSPRAFRGRAGQRQLPRLRAGGGEGVAVTQGRRTQTCCASTSATTARQPLLLDRLRAAAIRARATAPTRGGGRAKDFRDAAELDLTDEPTLTPLAS